MLHYYETYEYTPSGDPLTPDGIDLKGSCTATAHDTLEEAIEYADERGLTLISEIGGSWDEYEKCAFCGEWFTGYELNQYGDCERCVQAMNDHGGYRPRTQSAEVIHLGEWVECTIEARYNDNTYRVSIPQYDHRGRLNGEWCATVDAWQLRNIR